MIPFRLSLEPGTPIHEQVVYAAKKAIVCGRMVPGDSFPSVRLLSRALRINPNTAHKVVTQLIAEGLLEVHPGLGTLVAQRPTFPASGRAHLLRRELEQLVVEARKLGLDLDELTEYLAREWRQVGRTESTAGRKG